VGYVEESPSFIPEKHEVSRIIKTEVSWLMQSEIRQRTHLEINPGLRLDTPYFAIDGEVVWGATAMILSELTHLLKDK
jgi:hypothetical protein